MKYVVYRKEVWVNTVYIEAPNKREALKLARHKHDKRYNYELDEFSHDLPISTWKVTKE